MVTKVKGQNTIFMFLFFNWDLKIVKKDETRFVSDCCGVVLYLSCFTASYRTLFSLSQIIENHL
jgi:hypothetical protein